MLNFLWNKIFGLKCPTPGCKKRLKQVKESPRPMADQFFCKRCDITYTGSQLKQFNVNGYNKIDPTGRRKQAILQVSYECPICYETFSMSLRKSVDVSALRFLCPICAHYFPNPKYVKPEPTPVVRTTELPGQEPLPWGTTTANSFSVEGLKLAYTTIPPPSGPEPTTSFIPFDPAAEFVPVPVLNKCDTCSQEFGDCAGGITFDGQTDAVIECTGYTAKTPDKLCRSCTRGGFMICGEQPSAAQGGGPGVGTIVTHCNAYIKSRTSDGTSEPA
ncbi:MAG: hypothetical protein IMZ61_09745 [Planctomycetes bacterium]|nr:hypothetical protein [Planctomycetota bacterium]